MTSDATASSAPASGCPAHGGGHGACTAPSSPPTRTDVRRPAPVRAGRARRARSGRPRLPGYRLRRRAGGAARPRHLPQGRPPLAAGRSAGLPGRADDDVPARLLCPTATSTPGCARRSPTACPGSTPSRCASTSSATPTRSSTIRAEGRADLLTEYARCCRCWSSTSSSAARADIGDRWSSACPGSSTRRRLREGQPDADEAVAELVALKRARARRRT